MRVFRFESFSHWVNKAKRWFEQSGLTAHDVVCIDAVGRICGWGAHFRRAEEEGTYPVTVYSIEVLEGAWPERVNEHLSWAAFQVGYMLRAVGDGRFDDDGPAGALGCSREAQRRLAAAEYWCTHPEPQCEHEWANAGEGYFEIYAWCMRCGALNLNGDLGFPDPGAKEIRWL